MTIHRCPGCGCYWSNNSLCETCLRHEALGVLVLSVLTLPRSRILHALDAISLQLGACSRLRKKHRKELNEEIRSAQQDARESYHSGLADGRSAAKEDW